MRNYHKGVFVRIVVVGQEEEKQIYNELSSSLATASFSFVTIYHELTELKACDFIILDTSLMVDAVVERLDNLELLERTLVILSPEHGHMIGGLLRLGAKDVFLKPVLAQEIAAKIEGFNNLLRHPIFQNSRYGLSLKQQKIFELLKVQRTDGVTRSEVLKTVWPQQQVSEKSVDVHIYNLRKSLTPFNMKIEHQSNRWFLVG
jgi:DNA-binding response OmpR family regulator